MAAREEEGAHSSGAAAASTADDVMTEQVDERHERYTMASLCMECGEMGVTRILPTVIPFFREVLVMAFECPHCHTRNSELKVASDVQALGMTIELRVNTPADLNRRVVKSEHAVVRVPAVELEIPAQQAVITTVEGLLTTVIDDLESTQDERRKVDVHDALAVGKFIRRLRELLSSEDDDDDDADAAASTRAIKPFVLYIDDLSGNSFVENPNAPAVDPQLKITHRRRTRRDCETIGVVYEEEMSQAAAGAAGAARPQGTIVAEGERDGGLMPSFFERFANEISQVMSFDSSCAMCHASGDTKMCTINIPYFKECVIMAYSCDSCGYRNNEVKAGGGVSPLGRRHTCRIEQPEDLNRDILKSETATLEIPEIQFRLESGTLGGKFSTIEGIIQSACEQLESFNPFAVGDSKFEDQHAKWVTFVERLRAVTSLERPFTVVLDDPLGNSFINKLSDGDDPRLTIEDYTRSAEQDEDFGIADMKTENYSPDEPASSSAGGAADAAASSSEQQ